MDVGEVLVRPGGSDRHQSSACAQCAEHPHADLPGARRTGPVSDSLNLAGAKLGNYRLLRILGRGNMGVVYLATDEALLRPTAVKVLTWSPVEHDPEAWFLAEARSVARLNHPSVIQIYSVAKHGPYCYIAMEYVDGVSADVMVSREGRFSAERAT